MNSDLKQKIHKDFKIKIKDTECYAAGYPSYPRNFSRDVLLAAIISNDNDMLKNQIELNIQHQGLQTNPLTGEEIGKIYHEYPGVDYRDSLNTMYNACDTTALFLIGLEELLNKDKIINSDRYIISAEAAVRYIQKHIKSNIFWEFPPADSNQFSLKITYWKDSIMPKVNGVDEPKYPIAYALVQFQNARAMLAASRILKRKDLKMVAHNMYITGIKTFITKKDFIIAIDGNGFLAQNSSDELHSLAYIPKKYRYILPIKQIKARANSLETPAGFACTPREVGLRLKDRYHGYVVWVFEQSIINYGCKKFWLSKEAKTAKRCLDYIDEGQELLSVAPQIAPLGNNKQLWSLAAQLYFTNKKVQKNLNWL